MSRSKIKLEKFEKALASLKSIYLKPAQEDRIYVDATIHCFDFTFDLLWKSLKAYFDEIHFRIRSYVPVLQSLLSKTVDR